MDIFAQSPKRIFIYTPVFAYSPPSRHCDQEQDWSTKAATLSLIAMHFSATSVATTTPTSTYNKIYNGSKDYPIAV